MHLTLYYLKIDKIPAKAGNRCWFYIINYQNKMITSGQVKELNRETNEEGKDNSEARSNIKGSKKYIDINGDTERLKNQQIV